MQYIYYIYVRIHTHTYAPEIVNTHTPNIHIFEGHTFSEPRMFSIHLSNFPRVYDIHISQEVTLGNLCTSQS